MDSKITSKGQITLPKPVREKLGLAPGDRVKFFFDPDDHLLVLPTLPMTALKGILKTRSEKPASLEEMDEAIGQGIVERYEDAIRR